MKTEFKQKTSKYSKEKALQTVTNSVSKLKQLCKYITHSLQLWTVSVTEIIHDLTAMYDLLQSEQNDSSQDEERETISMNRLSHDMQNNQIKTLWKAWRVLLSSDFNVFAYANCF